MAERKSKFCLALKYSALLQVLFLLCLFTPLECRENLKITSVKKIERFLEQSPSNPSRVRMYNSRGWRILFGIIFGSISGVVLALCLAMVVRLFILYMNRTPILNGPVVFSPKISPKDLQSAIENESELLGSSPNGKCYQVVLDNGHVVVVKKLQRVEIESSEAQSKAFKRQIQRELELLAQLSDPNLMALQAYFFREPDRYSLVYEYMPKGSLDDAMARVRENQLKLEWEVRHRIAVGVIKGLRYLHFDCSPRILHYDLKPANILLNEEFEPRLGDCGLAKLMPNLSGVASGYIAPECFQNRRYSDKSDIFSFGVILGVLLTGRDPLDPFFNETSGGSLGRWLRQLQQVGEAREGLDKALLGQADEDEMLMAIRIAVVCMSDLPTDRPSSDELVPMLTQLHIF